MLFKGIFYILPEFKWNYNFCIKIVKFDNCMRLVSVTQYKRPQNAKLRSLDRIQLFFENNDILFHVDERMDVMQKIVLNVRVFQILKRQKFKFFHPSPLKQVRFWTPCERNLCRLLNTCFQCLFMTISSFILKTLSSHPD